MTKLNCMQVLSSCEMAVTDKEVLAYYFREHKPTWSKKTFSLLLQQGFQNINKGYWCQQHRKDSVTRSSKFGYTSFHGRDRRVHTDVHTF